MSDGAKESRDGAQLAVVVVLLSFNSFAVPLSCVFCDSCLIFAFSAMFV